MKNVVKGGLLALAVGCLMCTGVEAKYVYYTNEAGVEMTELEYNKMVKIYSERLVKNLSQEDFDKYKNANIVDSDSVYYKTTYIDGEVAKEETISAEEYEEASSAEVSEGDISTYAGDFRYMETSYKKLSGTLTDAGNGYYSLIGALSWKKVPVCRSYDVFAYRFNHFDYSGFGGNQAYYTSGLYNNIKYDTSSPGYKAQATGAGVSMNLVDGSNITGYELTVATNLYVNSTNYSQAHAYLSYQHAQSDLTREQSLGYTLNISGLGNVILFSNSSIASKYDGMDGVHLIAAL